MNLQKILDEQHLSKYKLSQITGIPKTTILDLCSGKTNLENCATKTAFRIAKALGYTLDGLLSLCTDLVGDDSDIYDDEGRPIDKSYLECGLPQYLYDSINQMKKTWEILDSGKRNNTYDLDFCELQADINRAENDEVISSEQAWYLREKYLRMIREEDF